MKKNAITVTIDGKDLTPSATELALRGQIQVQISAAAAAKIAENRSQLDQLISLGRPLYGINTGFGVLCDRKISADQLDALQENLLISHAVGVGDPVPPDIIRLMLLFKIVGLARGHSGIRPQVVTLLADMLSADLLPVVPCKGSLGASGDLAPLAHLALPLIGRGNVRQAGKIVGAKEAFAGAGLQPLTLTAKEGLALINGTQFMSAYGAALCAKARRLCTLADVLAATSLEAIRGHIGPFDSRLHAVRPHPGAMASADNVRALLAGRPAKPGTRPYGKRVQDPYSLRCVPAVHGACRDVVDHVEPIVYREINSVTDNPVVFEGAVLSGGNFHGQPLAMALDYLAIALAELASISERRQYLLVNDTHYGLPSALVPDSGLNSGFMIAHYTTAALVSENKVLCHPASVDSIPTSGGQEDHVSMGATAAVKGWQVLQNLEQVLAIELLTAVQALEFTPISEIAPAIRQLREFVRGKIPSAQSDREFGTDIKAALELVLAGEMLDVVSIGAALH